MPCRDAFNSLAKLGFHCRCLQQFVELHEGRQTSSSYKRALARGVAGMHGCFTSTNGTHNHMTEALDVYRQAVLRLQHVTLADPTISLSTMQHFLYDFQARTLPTCPAYVFVQHK